MDKFIIGDALPRVKLEKVTTATPLPRQVYKSDIEVNSEYTGRLQDT